LGYKADLDALEDK